MDFDHGGGSRKTFDVNDSDIDSNAQGNDLPISSSSSSSQDFVLDINVLNDKFGKFKQEPQGSIWTPEVAGQAPQPSSSLTKGYDPKRIPSAIFARKPATPVEWSVASNESLFSIQLGNGSFSRDHVLMLYKSGELSKQDESIKLANCNDSSKLSKPTMMGMAEHKQPVHVQSNLPVVTEVENMDRKAEDNLEKGSQGTESTHVSSCTEKDVLEKGSQGTESTHVCSYTQKDVIVETGEDHSQEKMSSPEDISVSSRSDESINSTKSFAFPLLEGGVARNSSVNVEVDKVDNDNKPSTSEPKRQPNKQFQEPVLPQSHAATAKSAASRCFSCFYCFSHCR